MAIFSIDAQLAVGLGWIKGIGKSRDGIGTDSDQIAPLDSWFGTKGPGAVETALIVFETDPAAYHPLTAFGKVLDDVRSNPPNW